MTDHDHTCSRCERNCGDAMTLELKDDTGGFSYICENCFTPKEQEEMEAMCRSLVYDL